MLPCAVSSAPLASCCALKRAAASAAVLFIPRMLRDSFACIPSSWVHTHILPAAEQLCILHNAQQARYLPLPPTASQVNLLTSHPCFDARHACMSLMHSAGSSSNTAEMANRQHPTGETGHLQRQMRPGGSPSPSQQCCTQQSSSPPL